MFRYRQKHDSVACEAPMKSWMNRLAAVSDTRIRSNWGAVLDQLGALYQQQGVSLLVSQSIIKMRLKLNYWDSSSENSREWGQLVPQINRGRRSRGRISKKREFISCIMDHITHTKATSRWPMLAENHLEIDSILEWHVTTKGPPPPFIRSTCVGIGSGSASSASSVLHGLVRCRYGGGGGGRFVCGLSDLDGPTQGRSTGESPHQVAIWRCVLRYLSLRPLLQALQEGSHIVVVVDGELHVLAHDRNGNILRERDRNGKLTSLICASTELQCCSFDWESSAFSSLSIAIHSNFTRN